MDASDRSADASLDGPEAPGAQVISHEHPNVSGGWLRPADGGPPAGGA